MLLLELVFETVNAMVESLLERLSIFLLPLQLISQQTRLISKSDAFGFAELLSDPGLDQILVESQHQLVKFFNVLRQIDVLLFQLIGILKLTTRQVIVSL